MGWLGMSQETRMGVRARVSKTGREKFRIQEMWGVVGIQGVWLTGRGESVGSEHRKGSGQEGWNPGMGRRS